MRKWIIFFSAIALAVTAQSISVAASDTEWDRTVLPRPPQPFEGVTKRTLEGSVASYTQPVKAPPDAPNILLVLIDDAGFGNPSTFGGPVAARHSTNWQPKDCVTIASTSQHFVPRRARRCCPDGIIMPWDSGRFVNWLAVGRVTARTGRRAPRQSPRTSAQRLQHRCNRQMASYAGCAAGTRRAV